MKRLIDARDVRVGDMIPGVGKVRTVRSDATTVAFELDWATTADAVLSPDHVVWIEREVWAP